MTTILQDNPCIVRSKYNHKVYTLYKCRVGFRVDSGGREFKDMYFFALPERIAERSNHHRYKPCPLPENYTIAENKIGAPFLVDKVNHK